MPTKGNTVVRKPQRLTKDRAKTLVAAGLQRAVADHGKDEIALAGGCSERCVEKALAHDTLPSIETLLNMLDTDPTVLDELLATKGWRLAPLHADAANDLETAAGIIDAMGDLVASQRDGIRRHNETLRIAKKLRPHLPAAIAIVREADELQGAA